MKTRKLIACAVLIVLLAGILGTAAASPLRVYAYSQATGKPVSNTVINAFITPTSSTQAVWSKSGTTNTGNYAFEVPSQYTGPSYRLTVSARQTSLRISNGYTGAFKTSVTLAMR
jgi:hypothetical protein